MNSIRDLVLKLISNIKIWYNLFSLLGGGIPPADEFGHRWDANSKCVLCACTRYESDDQFWYTTENMKHASNNAWNCGNK